MDVAALAAGVDGGPSLLLLEDGGSAMRGRFTAMESPTSSFVPAGRFLAAPAPSTSELAERSFLGGRASSLLSVFALCRPHRRVTMYRPKGSSLSLSLTLGLDLSSSSSSLLTGCGFFASDGGVGFGFEPLLPS
jgi:hypothetical protein